MKKLYKKGFDYYPSMTDKSAARVICKFKQDLQIVKEIIQESFEVINEDNKIHHLDYTKQGYKSILFSAHLRMLKLDLFFGKKILCLTFVFVSPDKLP